MGSAGSSPAHAGRQRGRHGWRTRVVVCLTTAAMLVPAAGLAQSGQPGARRATTVDALIRFPLFFHGQRVVVWGRLEGDDRETWLISGSDRVRVWGQDVEGTSGGGPTVEVRGTFFDTSRLDPGDPRITANRLGQLTDARPEGAPAGADRPLVLVVSDHEPATTPPAPSIRALALDPWRYEGQTVTVVGRFRGNNLYGDLPDVPGRGRWEFVLQSADAAVWVSGRRPRGRDLDLDVDARADTGTWVEATGLVTAERGLVWLVARALARAEPPPPEETTGRAAPEEAVIPEVLFSAPSDGEIDVELTARVRIQFSRDMAAESFAGRVRLAYRADGIDAPPIPPVDVRYEPVRRVLEVAFREPLIALQQIHLELAEGITSRDGAPLAPWTLTFTLGPGR